METRANYIAVGIFTLLVMLAAFAFVAVLAASVLVVVDFTAFAAGAAFLVVVVFLVAITHDPP